MNNTPIEDNKTYRITMLDFLLSGKEINLDFLNESNSAITKIYPAETESISPLSDIRLAVVKYLQSMN